MPVEPKGTSHPTKPPCAITGLNHNHLSADMPNVSPSKWNAAMSQTEYDLVVIGSGPAGQKAALNAAKHGKSVAVVERTDSVGGVCIHTGTIPSKAVREAVLHLTGVRERSVYGSGYAVKHDIHMCDLLYR